MGVQVIPIPTEVVSHSLLFPFPILCFIPIPMGFPWESRSHWESHSHAHLYCVTHSASADTHFADGRRLSWPEHTVGDYVFYHVFHYYACLLQDNWDRIIVPVGWRICRIRRDWLKQRHCGELREGGAEGVGSPSRLGGLWIGEVRELPDKVWVTFWKSERRDARGQIFVADLC